MNKKPFEKFVISQAALLFRDDKCLILEAAPNTTYAGKAGFPGGRIDEGEAGKDEEAFRREINEELGLVVFDTMGIVDFDTWYTETGVPRAAVVRYIKNKTDEIVLSDEHSKYMWITENEIDHYTYAWKNAPRMLQKGFEFHRKLKK